MQQTLVPLSPQISIGLTSSITLMLKIAVVLMLCTAVLAGCTINPPVTEISPTPEGHAWWLRTTFHPKGKSIRGIGVQEIDPTWCAANEFSLDLFPLKATSDFGSPLREKMAENGTSFFVKGKFDGRSDMIALLGVYETCERTQGSFLLAVKQNSDKPHDFSLEEFPEARFGVLKPTAPDTIEIWWCFNCDGILTMKWSNSANRFLWTPEPDFE